MGAVEASQLSALSWQAPWEVLFLVVALALVQVSLLLTVIILSLTIMNWHRAILNNHPHNHHQQDPHPHPQVIFYLCLPTVLKLCTPAGLNLSLLATIHYSLVTFIFLSHFHIFNFVFPLLIPLITLTFKFQQQNLSPLPLFTTYW